MTGIGTSSGAARSVTGQHAAVLHGVGTGPGDPDLLTPRAVDALVGAGIVFLPGPTATGAAERVVLNLIEVWRVEPLVYGPGVPRPVRDSAVVRVAEWLRAHPGETAAFALPEDGCASPAFSRFARRVARQVPGLAVRLTPGVPVLGGAAVPVCRCACPPDRCVGTGAPGRRCA